MGNTIESASIKKNFIKYVSLNVLSMIGLSCYILADTIFVANGIGSDALAALNLVLPLYSFINGLGLMLGIGGATRYAIARGESDEKTANITFTHAAVTAAVVGLIMMVIGMLFGRQLAYLLGANEDVIESATQYLTTILVFAPAFLVNNVMTSFVRNDNQPRLAMIAMLLGSFANIVFDYIFIFPLKMGMFGAALATGIAPVLSICLISRYIVSPKCGFRLARCRTKIAEIKRIVEFGVPSFVNEFSYGTVMMIFNYTILGLCGNIGVAAYGVIANFGLVCTSIFGGIAQGIQPIISTAFGSKNSEAVRKTANKGRGLALILGVMIFVMGLLLPNQIVALFNPENNLQMQQIAVQGIMIYFSAFVFISINIVQTSVLTSTTQTTSSFIISIVRGFLAVVPLVLILPRLFGITGVWLAVPCAEAIALCFALYSIKRKKKSLS